MAERRRLQEAEIKDEEERRRKAEAEQRRRNEDERRQQEAVTRFDNPTLRLVEAEAEKRRQDEERRRLETEAKLAAKEEQRRKRLEQEPQQPVKPWLLPLIGAVVAALPMLALYGFLRNSPNPADVRDAWWCLVFSPINALYGGAAGMLVQRLGIPKAVAIPFIPAFLLSLVFLAFVQPWDTALLPISFISVGPACFFTWLAFWLHSRWARKQRLREAQG